MHAPGSMNVKIVRYSLNPKKGIAACIVPTVQFLVLQYKKRVAVHLIVAKCINPSIISRKWIVLQRRISSE